MRRILAIGLTGQVGEALLPSLPALGEVWGLSRDSHPDQAGITWLRGSLQSMPPLPQGIDTVLSLGPLDAFADWFERVELPGVRVIALGSTGRQDKRDSNDPRERDVAVALSGAEGRLFAAGFRRGAAITVLRPTLMYGRGRDDSMSAMLALARRFGVVVLPAGATGLRQPVHVDDVAGAVLACLAEAASEGHAFDLPGGEKLAFRAMVERSLARHAPGVRVRVVPRALFRSLLALVGLAGIRPVGPGFLERVGRDQVADGSTAGKALGYRPRGFEP